jgi:hypothetical protein
MSAPLLSESLDTGAVGRFVEVSREIKDLEDRLKALKSQRDELQEGLLEQFSSAGVSSVRVDGLTVSLRREVWATCKESNYERACAALTAAGLSEFVQPRFNAHTLSAYVRELDRDGKPLPKEFDGAIEVSERFSLRATAR